MYFKKEVSYLFKVIISDYAVIENVRIDEHGFMEDDTYCFCVSFPEGKTLSDKKIYEFIDEFLLQTFSKYTREEYTLYEF